MKADDREISLVSPRMNLWRLFFISAVALFIEIMLIRWVSTEIRIFAYFKNLALIACFFGLGLGVLWEKRFRGLTLSLVLMTLIVVMVRPPFFSGETPLACINEFLSFDDSFQWVKIIQEEAPKIALGVFLLILLFGLIVAAMIPMGQAMGRCFSAEPRRILAYSSNIAGSLLGIWVFTLLSNLSLSPAVWIGIGMICLLLLSIKDKQALVLGIPLIVVAALAAQGFPEQRTGETWSPYQKLVFKKQVRAVVHESRIEGGGETIIEKVGYYELQVNNTFYQFILDLSERFVKQHPLTFHDLDRQRFDYYNMPYNLFRDAENILIVGAGMGNDVAAALRNTKARIDAVEIDPAIARLGRKHHPEKPYENTGVTLWINDARSFFKTSKNTRRYDLIIFGSLDAHTLSSNFSNISLDNYVYTLESFIEAKNLLSERGLIIVGYHVDRTWIGARLSELLAQAFKTYPLVVQCYNPWAFGWIYVVGNPVTLAEAFERDSALLTYVRANQINVPQSELITRDDWPYFFLKDWGIPKLMLIVSGVLAGITLLGGLLLNQGKQRLDGHMFFLGAAFLLIEVSIISKLMLLFGSTWVVNVFVISAVLVMILLANLLVLKRPPKNLNVVYILLFASLLLVYFLSPDQLFLDSYWVKGIIASLVYSLPIFFAGIIFATSFAHSPSAPVALGSNLIGGVLGGLLECVSYSTGIRFLAIVAMLVYMMAYVTAVRLTFLKSKLTI